MKVQDLIIELQKLDPNLEILVEGYEGHYDSSVLSDVVEFEPNVNSEWYYGSHELRKGGSMKGIILKKKSKNNL